MALPSAQGDRYQLRMRELQREILRGHEVLLDFEPPYPSGSFRFLDSDLGSDGKGIELWRGLALYMQIDPDSIGRADDEAMAFLRELQPLAGAASNSVAAIYWRRLWELGRDVVSGAFECETRRANPHLSLVARSYLFGTLEQTRIERVGEKFGWLPGGAYLFPYRPGEVPPLQPFGESSVPGEIDEDPQPRFYGDASPPYKWPWGSHETTLLRMLVGVAGLWKTIDQGGNYDPSDPTTAPTLEQVDAWLQRNGVKNSSLSKAINQMLKPDDFPDGRRAKKVAAKKK